jgi:hypothetical protein
MPNENTTVCKRCKTMAMPNNIQGRMGPEHFIKCQFHRRDDPKTENSGLTHSGQNNKNSLYIFIFVLYDKACQYYALLSAI